MLLCIILGLVGSMSLASGSESVLDLFPEFRNELSSLRNEISNKQAATQNKLAEMSTTLNNYISASVVQKAYAVGYIEEATVCTDCIIPFSTGQSEPKAAFQNGAFTVPYDGIYIITWTITSNGGRCIYCNLDYGGKSVYNSFTDSYDRFGTDLASTSTTLVCHVTKGTVIGLRRSYKNGCRDDRIHRGLITVYKLY